MKREALAEIAMFPIGEGASLSASVARAVNIIAQSGLAYTLTAMGTIIEGTYEEISAVVGACLRALSKDSERVYATVKIDWRKGRENAIEGKTRSVEAAMQELERRA